MKKTIKKINTFILNLFIIIFFTFVISCTDNEKLNNNEKFIEEKNIDFQKPPENSNWELIDTKKFESGDKNFYFIIWNDFEEKKWIITDFQNNFKENENIILESNKFIELLVFKNKFYLFDNKIIKNKNTFYLDENNKKIFRGIYKYIKSDIKNINEINLPKINEENGLILNWN